MATSPSTRDIPLSEYPTGDGKPMAETPLHGDIMFALVEILRAWYAHDPNAYVSGNMMMYYVRNDKRRHVAPDVFVTLGIPSGDRDAYFVWVEGKGPDVVIEVTSPSTRREDQQKKFLLYQDTLHVREYFLFDPRAEYLRPPLQGYRLEGGRYEPIAFVDGRLPSQVLGLDLERDGKHLRLIEPASGFPLLTAREALVFSEAERREAEAERRREEARRKRAEAESERLNEALRAAEAERQRMAAELQALRKAARGEGG